MIGDQLRSVLVRVLVVEDDWLFAMCLAEEVYNAGGEVMGPAPSVKKALALIDKEECFQLAVLDVNLTDGESYKVADAAMAKGAKVVFVTSENARNMPPPYRFMPVYGKPVSPRMLHQIVRAAA